jgi:Glycosyltransferases involved in cell wall biogenesis
MKIVFCVERDTNSKVAVLVSLYNYEKYICEALDSVAKQSLSDIELIVCNDCSTDNSAAIVLDWMQRHRQRFSRLALIENDSNSGLAATRNVSVAFAIAPYIFILDADNMIYPACLERSLEVLEEAAADAAFVYAQREIFDDTDPSGGTLENLQDWDPQIFCQGNHIDAMVLHKKSALDAVGGYAADDWFGRLGWEDYELWLKYIRAGFYGIKINQPLIRYRYHKASMLRATTNIPKNMHRLWQRLHVLYPEIIAEQMPYEPLPVGRFGWMIKYFNGLERYIRSNPWLLRLARTPFAVTAKKVFQKLYRVLSEKNYTSL